VSDNRAILGRKEKRTKKKKKLLHVVRSQFVEAATESFRIALDPSESLRLVIGELDVHLSPKTGFAEETANVLSNRKAFLLETGLHKMVGALVHRGDLNGDVSTGVLINTLFLRCLELLIYETDSEEAITTVFKMLNSDLRFYSEGDNNSIVKKYFASKSDEGLLDFVDAKAPLISHFYLRVANAFCKMKGFDIYGERLANTDPRAPLACTRLMLRTLFKVAPFVRPEYLREHLAKLKVVI
jgi:hypothetical protein